MYRNTYLTLLTMASIATTALSSKASEWAPVEGSMLTEWGESVTPTNAWQVYPRPQMQRTEWTNLNGLWNYKVTDLGARNPQSWDGEILVPYALETPLSGVGRRLEPSEALWYQRRFKISKNKNEKTLLHFEGVDYACQVWLNGTYIGDHRGGNLPFSLDASAAIADGENTLLLRVIDETDAFDRYQLRGKQRQDNRNIWYTPSSGIWQTVWLESVPETYLKDIRFTADMHGAFKLEAMLGGEPRNDLSLRIHISDEGGTAARSSSEGSTISVDVNSPHLWSTEDPHLYDLTVELVDSDNQVLDTVESYVGFRTTGKAQDTDGNWRFTLNGKPIFHLGPLDQGWWPDGFLNPPSDDAMVWEMQYLKEAGFNMIRKHKKVEPRRYYYHADRLGFLVWQDQVSGGAGPNEWPKWKKLRAEEDGWEPRNENWWQPGQPIEADWPDWAHQQYMDELKVMVDTLHNHPSVVVWTAFNERWGQHRSMEVGEWLVAYDPTRHLNIASGGNFFPVGDIADEHQYPHPSYPLGVALYDDYIKVMGEFGGHGWRVDGHQWDPNKKIMTYGDLPSSLDEYKERYRESMRILADLMEKGVAAGVYTQTTDVEGEINGLLTYDRKVAKLSAEEVKAIHQEFIFTE